MLRYLQALSLCAFVLSLFGCASFDTAHRNAFSRLEQADTGEFVSGHTGLTQEGCGFFFPEQDSKACFVKWQEMEFADRVAYFKREASPIMRGFWEVVREMIIDETLVPRLRLAMPSQEIDRLIQQMAGEDPVAQCTTSGLLANRAEEDLCFFLFTRTASEQEVTRMIAYVEGLGGQNRPADSELLRQQLGFGSPYPLRTLPRNVTPPIRR